MTDPGSIEVPGHAQWLLLALGEDVDVECASRADSLLNGQASPEFRDEVIAVMAGLSRQVQEQAVRLAAEEVAVVGAWMLLPAPGLLLPGPVATLRYAPLPAGWDAIAVAGRGAATRHGQPLVEELPTASGKAFAVRDRPVVALDDRQVVHESRSVVWLRPSSEECLCLTMNSADLVKAAWAAEPLAELAATVHWVAR